MLSTPKPRSAFHAGQFVKVQVNSQKTEVGSIESLDDNSAVVVTSSGYRVTRTIAALVPAWLIVLDLNGVLGYRQTSKIFKKRPHVDELLQFLFKNFVVGVWTSCTETNGVRIITDVFRDYEHRLLFKMFRDECTPNPTQDNRYGTFKDLRRVWDRYPAFNAGNTIMIDDSEDKCSHRHNALCPTPYSEDITAAAEAADVGLREIMTVLDEAVKVGTLEPLRVHMMKRWADQESATPPLGVTPLTSEVSFTWASADPTAPTPPAQPVAPARASGDGPFGANSSTQKKRNGGLQGATPPTRSKATAIRVAQRARQDACDSEEERGRPSVGNTPLAGPPGVLSNVAAMGNSPPINTGDLHPGTSHRGHSLSTSSPPQGAGMNTAEKITSMIQKIALQKAQQHARQVRTQRAGDDSEGEE